MALAKNTNLALAFVLELCMLAALCYWGFVAGNGILQKLALGLGVPLVVAVIWGLFAAPRAMRRLTGAGLFALKALLFCLAAVALWAAGLTVLAAVFIVVVALNGILLYVWRQ